MNLGTKGRYAVMAMVELAEHRPNIPMTLGDVARAQEISVAYLEQIFCKLKRKGLIKSERGPGGGYLLAKTAVEISIGDIFQAVDESLKMTRCDQNNTAGCMTTGARCLTHHVWDNFSHKISDYLHSVTLADIQNGRARNSLPLEEMA